MNVLVAFEYSGIVRDAFIEAGHNAISVDLLPSESNKGPHIQGDVRGWLQQYWDLVIAHVPCTHLTNANLREKPYHLVRDAITLFQKALNANAPLVCVENPLMKRVYREELGEPSQLIQPYQFGDYFQKKTYLWLKGLPLLVPTTDIVYSKDIPRWVDFPSRGQPSGVARVGHDRSRFWPGIARAMAEQWGRL